VSCDFSVAVSILDMAGAELVDLNDHALGLDVEQVVEPEESWRTIRVQAPRVDGPGAVVAVAEDGGVLLVRVHVHGETWAEVASRWQTVRAAYRASHLMQVRTVIEGVTKTWVAERPNVTPEPVTSAVLATKWQTYALQFVTYPLTETDES
jgi:hypothetical protein